MDFSDVLLTVLRVSRAVAEEGTFTTAAASLGYIQPEVFRQIAAIERVRAPICWSDGATACGSPRLADRHAPRHDRPR